MDAALQSGALFAPRRKGHHCTPSERAEAIAWAREWRRRTKPLFDAIYGPDERDAPGYDGWMQREARGEQ